MIDDDQRNYKGIKGIEYVKRVHSISKSQNDLRKIIMELV